MICTKFMRQRRYLKIMVFAILLLSACSVRKDKNEEKSSDSLFNEVAQFDYGNYPERALDVIDSAERVAGLAADNASYLRARVFCKSCILQRQDTAILICEALMKGKRASSSPEFRQDVLELLVNSSRMRQDDEALIKWSVQLSDLLREQNLHTEAFRTEAEIGLALTHVGQLDEGLAKIDNCISHLEGVRRFNEMDALIIVLKRKICVLREQNRYADIIPVARHIQELLDDYAAHPEVFHDGTYREPENADRQGYIEFYRAQATAYIAQAYAEMGELKQAEHEMVAFEQTDYSKFPDGRKQMTAVLEKLGRYDEVLDIYDDVEQSMIGEQDTLRNDYADILHGRARIAYLQGNYALSRSLEQRYISLSQKLNENLQRSKAHLYAARFRAYEQQIEIEQQQAALSRKNIFIGAGVLLSLLAIGFSLYYWRQKQLISRKNHVLTGQIAEAVDYKKKYEQLRLATQQSAIAKKPSVTAHPDVDTNLNNLTDADLFGFLSDAIIREELFLDPFFGRQTLVNRFHLSPNRVGAAFSQGSEHNSLPGYIRNLRLEHSCRLLTSSPDMSIDEVATASGFSNYTVFARYFKQKYDITPSEYRRQRQT